MPLKSGLLGVTSRNGKIERQEPTEQPLVANSDPFPPLNFLLCPVEAYPSLTSGTGR